MIGDTERPVKRCPRTGRKIGRSVGGRLLRWWLSPVIGLAALLWFLIRVIPKPSRATYPCQRLAFPLASGFIVWLMQLAGAVVAYRKARFAFLRARYIVAAVCAAVSVMFVWSALGPAEEKIVYAHEPIVPNSPIGQARGVFAGRVVWIHDANATDWAGPGSGQKWYSDDCTDQNVVNAMLSKALRALTGRDSDSQAWDVIFRSFNERQGKGYIGYSPGEKIAIKINFVLMYGDPWPYGQKPSDRLDRIDNSPQLAIALLGQLIDVAGVNPSDICIGDPSMMMPDYWYNMVSAVYSDVVYITKPGYDLSGRTQISYDYSSPFYWSDPCAAHWEGVAEQDYIPSCFSQADYFINFAILKSHTHAGITVCGKNHFGSLSRKPDAPGYYDMHWSRVLPGESPGMGRYRAIVDLLGHPRLGGKTMLSLIDGLYSGRGWDSWPHKWQMSPFNNDWPSSIFLSQDRVAIDSVAFDFLYTEWDSPPYDYPHMSGTDDYLHEAAMIPSPASGVSYDPNGDGGLVESLGVHEHWNNPVDKQYSRNLDPVFGTGIELVRSPSVAGDFVRDNIVDYRDFAVFAKTWHSQPGQGEWNPACDLVVDEDNIIDERDLTILCDNWLD